MRTVSRADEPACDGRCNSLRWHLRPLAFFLWLYASVSAVFLIAGFGFRFFSVVVFGPAILSRFSLASFSTVFSASVAAFAL